MALKDYDRALEIEPTYARAYNTRGNSRSALGLFEEALKDYELVSPPPPPSPSLIFSYSNFVGCKY